MKLSLKLSLLFAAALLLITLFMLWDAGGNWSYVLPRRGKKILAVILTGSAIALSTVIFQTITNNKILTPSIIGLDSLYMLVQTAIVFLYGSTTLTAMNKNVHFLISSGIMVLFSLLLYHLLFKKRGHHIYFLLLVGLVCGTFFGSLSSFMQMLIDPNEFQFIQDRMFASFNNVNSDILILAFTVLGLTLFYFYRFTKYLDVMSLGRDHALNLGVPYDYAVKHLLGITVILVSVSTALVGPITFLGLLVANISYSFVRTYRHRPIILGAIGFGIVALVGGLLLVERVFVFRTTVSVIINFAGGVYFIYLLLKENKA